MNALSSDNDGGVTSALVSHSGDDLVDVRRSQGHALRFPSLEVTCYVDRTTDHPSGVLLGVADRPKLLERLCAIDRRLVDASGRVDVVGRAVAGH